MTKNGLGASVGGLAQPKCFFAAYDDIREEVIILLEDFGERALTAGDQISGGPAAGKPPSLEAFLPAFKAAGEFNGKFFNSTNVQWEGLAINETFRSWDWPAVAAIMTPGFVLKWAEFQSGCKCMGIEISENMMAFGEFFGPFQDEVIAASDGIEIGGVCNVTVGHGDFRLENIFFKEPGSDEVPVAFIDFQLIQRGLVTFDPMYFLMNSVPVDWRRENELACLNAFYDSLIATDKVDPAVYTWELYCVELQVALCSCIYNPVYVGADAEKQAPGGVEEDARKFELTKTLASRFMVCIDDWGVSIDTLKAMKARADAKSSQAEIAAEAVKLVPAKYLEGRTAA